MDGNLIRNCGFAGTLAENGFEQGLWIQDLWLWTKDCLDLAPWNKDQEGGEHFVLQCYISILVITKTYMFS